MNSAAWLNETAHILCCVLVALIVAQGLWALRYVWTLCHFRRSNGDASYCPKAAAILCVRGCDHRMEDTLRALFRQDYPEFDVRIIVDSRTDPAWNIVHAIAAESAAKNVRIEALAYRHNTCSRKISGVLQAIKGLDESHKVILLLDADAHLYPRWMRKLVAPLADPTVAATTGNRWYMPETPSWGGLACYAWNAAAVVQMYLYGMTWGGSMAISCEMFSKTDLLAHWTTAFAEDASMVHAVTRRGYKVVYVPSVTMVNRGDYTIPGLINFIERQLLIVKHEGPWWVPVLAHGYVTSALLGGATLTGLTALAVQEWHASLLAGVGLGSYLLGCVLYLAMIELAIRRVVSSRGEETRWLTAKTVLKLPFAILLAQVVHFLGLTRTLIARTHNWRNVIYRFGGVPRVSVIADKAA